MKAQVANKAIQREKRFNEMFMRAGFEFVRIKYTFRAKIRTGARLGLNRRGKLVFLCPR